jgi:hypothetical protein
MRWYFVLGSSCFCKNSVDGSVSQLWRSFPCSEDESYARFTTRGFFLTTLFFAGVGAGPLAVFGCDC